MQTITSTPRPAPTRSEPCCERTLLRACCGPETKDVCCPPSAPVGTCGCQRTTTSEP